MLNNRTGHNSASVPCVSHQCAALFAPAVMQWNHNLPLCMGIGFLCASSSCGNSDPAWSSTCVHIPCSWSPSASPAPFSFARCSLLEIPKLRWHEQCVCGCPVLDLCHIWKQNLHINFAAVWTSLMWDFNRSRVVFVLKSHWSQLKTCPPCFIRMCCFKTAAEQNSLAHSSHMYFVSSCWDVLWILMSPLNVEE